MVIDPLDARNWNLGTPSYLDVRTGKTIKQKYDKSGNPTDGLQYHAWLDVASYKANGDDKGISYSPGYGPVSGPLGPGQYRLRIDTLEEDGTDPPSNGTAGSSYAHKGLAIRVTDSGGVNLCSAWSLAACPWSACLHHAPFMRFWKFDVNRHHAACPTTPTYAPMHAHRVAMLASCTLGSGAEISMMRTKKFA